ncbi:hypothetical protein [Sphingomonas cavernae]|uniref:hypothetical protein n=1 Tax=Sphingomonas cavernae TaxID=2320861 RepID=UPI0011C37D23|nr:hypothetical protein [Sphingomonas cavernae]
MTNADLAALLNRELGLTGAQAITVNVIRQWVLWDVLPKASAKGRAIGKRPDWNRDAVALRRARRLAELRTLGVRGRYAVIAQAYFEWGHSDFELVRGAIAAEFRRSAAQLLKGVTSETRFDDFSAISATRRKALQHQSGPLDKRFVGTKFEQSPELYLTSLNMIRTGEGDASQMSALVLQAAQQIAPTHATHLAPQISELLTQALPGLFGSDEEIANSGEETIRNSPKRNFRIARIALKRRSAFVRGHSSFSQFPQLPEELRELSTALIPLTPQITTGKWAISAFVAILHTLKNAAAISDKNQGLMRSILGDFG